MPLMSASALWVCLFLTTGLPAVRAEEATLESLAVDDGAIQEKLLSEGQKLLEAGKGVAAPKLLSQMNRPGAELRLKPTSAKRLRPEELYAKARDSVLIVAGLYKCDKCTHWHTSAAAGFAIAEPDVLVTNYHVVKETNRAILIGMTRDQQVYPIQAVLAASEAADVAILQLSGSRLKPLPLRANAPVGTEVSIISHPENRFFSFSRGLVSRYTARGGDTAKPPLMQVTADFAKGSSGGPVLDDSGNVVGMVLSTQAVFHNPDDFHTPQMVFKDCVPSSSILELLGPLRESRK